MDDAFGADLISWGQSAGTFTSVSAAARRTVLRLADDDNKSGVVSQVTTRWPPAAKFVIVGCHDDHVARSQLYYAGCHRVAFVDQRHLKQMLHRFYAFVGCGLVVLGGLHMLATLRLLSSPPSRLWFFGSGLAMALVGALNLLHRAYGNSTPGVRYVCWTANLVLTIFAVVAGSVTHASIAEYILIVALTGGALVLSLVRPASRVAPVAR